MVATDKQTAGLALAVYKGGGGGGGCHAQLLLQFDTDCQG